MFQTLLNDQLLGLLDQDLDLAGFVGGIIGSAILNLPGGDQAPDALEGWCVEIDPGTATAVRIPVIGGHSESVNIELKKSVPISEIKHLLASSPGVILEDDPKNNKYPMPIFAEGKNEVFVGRIRKDFSNPNTINLWIVADNLRKGAATNTIQIAEYIIKQNWK